MSVRKSRCIKTTGSERTGSLERAVVYKKGRFRKKRAAIKSSCKKTAGSERKGQFSCIKTAGSERKGQSERAVV